LDPCWQLGVDLDRNKVVVSGAILSWTKYDLKILTVFYQNRVEMVGVASIEVCKNWSGVFQSLKTAAVFFKIT
jgi:hypothetical protein